MDKQDVTFGELLNETEEELKIIIKSSIIDLTKEEKETLLYWIKEMKSSRRQLNEYQLPIH